MDAMPSGSYLAIVHAASDIQAEVAPSAQPGDIDVLVVLKLIFGVTGFTACRLTRE